MTAKRLLTHIVNKFIPVMKSKYEKKYNKDNLNFVSVIIF